MGRVTYIEGDERLFGFVGDCLKPFDYIWGTSPYICFRYFAYLFVDVLQKFRYFGYLFVDVV